MRVFQILDNDVLIINKDVQYADSLDNFKQDSGTTDFPNLVIYDDTQKQCNVDGELQPYPNTEYDAYIDNVVAYTEAKKRREYVAPSLEELKATAISIQYGRYEEKKTAPVCVNDYWFTTDEGSQRTWMQALTLIDDKGLYKVRDSSGSLALVEVTKEQLLEVGKKARAQQLAAYEWFMQQRSKINACQSEAALATYMR